MRKGGQICNFSSKRTGNVGDESLLFQILFKTHEKREHNLTMKDFVGKTYEKSDQNSTIFLSFCEKHMRERIRA